MDDNQGFLKPQRGFATATIHCGQEPDKWSGAIVAPIVTSTTFKRTANGHSGYVYGRSGNPTRFLLEECLAELDGGKYGLTFASGIGAISTVVSLLSKGDHIISSDDLYGGTSRLFREIVSRQGIEVSFVDFTKAQTLAKAIKPNTRMVWMETPTNPILKVLDIAGICRLVKSFGSIIVVVDNTFLTPYFQRPLDFGADIVVYSLTKYMNGHSDVVMGSAIVNDEDIMNSLHFLQKGLGNVPSPMDCYLVRRSLKTLAIRMQQHQKTGLIVAQWLQKHPNVTEVLHPGLPSHRQHELSKKQTAGSSGVFSFKHSGGLLESETLLSSLKVITLAESLGGFESLAELPVTMTHKSVPEKQRLEIGITDNLIRVSIGLEDAEDLIDDLEQAFRTTFP